MKLLVLSAVVLCALTLPSVSFAKSWWDSAKDVFNSKKGGEIVETIEQTIGKKEITASFLSNSDISAGLREALSVGTERVVEQLGVKNGFNLDPKIHIPLPGVLGRVDKALSTIGMGGLTDDLELRLNRAAEAATPKAKQLFVAAISEMTIEDAKTILTGPDNAATQYLRRTMGAGLNKEMHPLVEKALASAGAVKAYDQVMGQYGKLPFVPDVKANLKSYVVEKAMDGIFYYVGQEEAAIRKDPAKRTTDILKKVFASR